ncbi:MAG TPA: deoxyguanosinetriphosphate triphosphohydrolase [Planctomycetota bacterium]|nr:deoxyguanosinetriphosphate triphosphohydrolase [Planctomycetota bacterium]
MIRRTDLEEREERTLAPFAAKSGRTLGRQFQEPPHAYRTAFQRDRDRVVHSSAFRRLMHKTQVYIEHEGDYFRTRLTHSMEACQIGRTIARALNLNEDLAETLALVHDLGHPPFGHAGEDALAECMKGHGGFEHNLHGLRIADLLEQRYPDFPGLNLTWEVRESIVKHSVKPSMPAQFRPEWSPLLECQVVDLSDTIAYVSHDVDDAVKAGLVSTEQLRENAIWSEAIESVLARHADLRGELLSRQAVKLLIERLATDLIEHTSSRLECLKIRSLEDVRSASERAVDFSPPMREKVNQLYRFLTSNVYRHYRVTRMAEKGKRFLRDLFQTYTRRPEQLPPQFQRWAEHEGVERSVCDYLAGMTDRYAQEEVRRLFYPFEPLL